MEIKPCDKTIPLGRQGENLANTIEFDRREWVERYGVGTFQLLAKRAGDPAPYPVSISQELGVVTWQVTSADTAREGYGAAELYYYVGDVLAKSEIWQTRVLPSLGHAGDEPPEPYQSWVDEVLTAAQSVEEAVEHYPYIDSATYHWMAWDVEEAAWYDTGIVAQGQDGAPGDDGYSPTVSVTDIPGGHRVTITDADGAHTYDALDGAPGEVSEAELTEKLAEKVDKSAQATKTASMTEAVGIDDDGKLWVAPGGTVSDVQVDGVSVVTDGVANVPLAANDRFGVIKAVATNGVVVDSNGQLFTFPAQTANINARTQTRMPIVPANLDYAVKAAMTDGVGAAWTDAEKAAARARMHEKYELIETVTLTEDSTITRTKYPNGDDYNLAALFLRTSDRPASAGRAVLITGMKIGAATDSPYVAYWENGDYPYGVMRVDIRSGCADVYAKAYLTDGTPGHDGAIFPAILNKINIDSITWISLSNCKAGQTVEIWGIKA